MCGWETDGKLTGSCCSAMDALPSRSRDWKLWIGHILHTGSVVSAGPLDVLRCSITSFRSWDILLSWASTFSANLYLDKRDHSDTQWRHSIGGASMADWDLTFFLALHLRSACKWCRSAPSQTPLMDQEDPPALSAGTGWSPAPDPTCGTSPEIWEAQRLHQTWHIEHAWWYLWLWVVNSNR